jgi:plasmid stabilization system protein ParE
LKRVLIQPAARLELRESAGWYRDRNASAADRFVTQVFRTLEYIERSPAAGKSIPFVAGSARRLPVAGFPYYVVFEEFADRVEILAIAHYRRQPGYWLG